MLNFWSGNREVYSLSRSSKTVVMSGIEWERDDHVNVYDYYFDGYDVSEVWTTTPANMVDDNDCTDARTAINGDTQLLNHNTISATKDDKILSVEIKLTACKDSIPVPSDGISFTPIFLGSDGDEHIQTITRGSCDFKPFSMSCDEAWGLDWVDITDDTGSPSVWTWYDAANMNCRIKSKIPEIVGCKYVGIRITTLESPLDRIHCIRKMARAGETIFLDGFNTELYNARYFVRSFGWNLVSENPNVYEWMLELEEIDD